MYLIYKLTAPSGRFYVGVTSTTLRARWRGHVARARLRGTADNHPLYSSIRKYGAESFQTEVLAKSEDEAEALQAEIRYIEMLQAQTRGYNISKGGEYDWKTGIDRLNELRKDPAYDADYRARLRAGIAASAAHQAHHAVFAAAGMRWRAENARESYYIGYRNVRLARRAQGVPRGVQRDHRFSKECGRLWTDSAKVGNARAALGRSDRAREQWATMCVDKKRQVHQKIAERALKRNAEKTPEERALHAQQLAEARKGINHDLRKARQKTALIAYWTPERRAAKAEFMRQRHQK